MSYRTLRPAVAPVALAAFLCLHQPAPAQSPDSSQASQQPVSGVLSLSLPAQPLAASLQALSAASGTPIAFSPQVVAGKTAPAVRGSLSLNQALYQVLQGTGLQATREGGSVLIQAMPTKPASSNAPAESTTTMPAVGVTAVRDAQGPTRIQVNRADIERSNPSDLQDLFRSQPSVQVGSSLPISQKLYVQGVEETNLAVTIDGSRQNNKIFHHSATTLIDPSLLKVARVDAGVAPADAGPGALAGSVAYETLDARDLLAAGQALGGQLKSEYDDNGGVWAHSATLYGQHRGFEVLGFVKQASGGRKDDGDGRRIEGSGTDLFSGLGKLAYQADSGHRFELSHEQVQDDEARPYRANIGRVTVGRPVPATRQYDMQRRNTVFTYTDENPQGWWDPTVQLAYSVTELRLPEATQISRGQTDSLNAKVENRFTLSSLGSVTAGMDFYNDKARTAYKDLSDASSNESGIEKVRNTGVYAQARLAVSEQTRVSFGGRFDSQGFTGVDAASRRDEGWSFNASAEQDLGQYLTLSAGHADVWAGVPLAENLIINPAWVYPDRMQAVTSESSFLGLQVRMDGALKGLSLDARVFRTRIDDARAPTYRQNLGGPSLTRDLRATGHELGARYAWPQGFARVAYADVRTRIDGLPADSYTGNYLTTPIGRVLTLEAAHALATYRVRLGLDAQIVFKETDTYDVDTASRGQPLPAYEVLNVFAEYQPESIKGLTWRAEVNNVFDQAYTSRATYGQEYDTVEPLREPGRSVKLVLSYRF